MSDPVMAAVVAAIVSFVVGLISFISTLLVNRTQQLEFERKIQSQFTDRLYSMRLEYYSTAFDITDRIKHRPEPKRIIDKKELIDIRSELLNWKTGQVSLIISEKALKDFYELRDALSMGYGENEQFSIEQVEKIFSRRKNFRDTLRKDLGLLYTEDNKTK